MSTALYPGSFDPFHLGHLSVVEQVARRVDHLIVAALGNPTKRGLFTLEQRATLIARSVEHLDNVDATYAEGLLADLVVELDVDLVVRSMGKETANEIQMAAANQRLVNVETVLVAPSAALGHIGSRHIRAAVAAGRAAGLSNQVPPPVLAALMNLPPRDR